jgi:hypothetical protein
VENAVSLGLLDYEPLSAS